MTFDQEMNVIEQAMERDMADVQLADVQRSNGGHLEQDPNDLKAVWKHQVRALPVDVARLVGTIDLLSLRTKALTQIEEEIFGWTDRRDGRHPLDTATARMEWRSALAGSQRAATIKTIRHVVDDTKYVAQIQKLESHECASELASWQRNPLVRDGVLCTRDVARGNPTYGVRSYPEATPVEIPVFVARLWIQRTGKSSPNCWDLTAGSGTVHDVISTVFQGRVIGTDLALDNSITWYGDIREAGRHPKHERKGKKCAGDRTPSDVILTPDLIFTHPPSRGWPACCWIYGRRDAYQSRLDLGVLLDRKPYVEAITDAVRASLGHLAAGGLVSLLIPEYLRLHQEEVVADAGIADEVLGHLGSECILVERHQVVDEAPVSQASLGKTRGPVTHLILGKKAAS